MSFQFKTSAFILTVLFLHTVFAASAYAQDLFQSNIDHGMVMRFKSAQTLRRKGSTAQSISMLKNIVAQNPDYFLAWYNLGLAYTDKGDYTNGADALDKAIAIQLKLLASNKIQPEFTIYNTAGWAHMQLNQYDIAEKYFKVALVNLKQLPSQDSQSRVLNNYGLLEMKQGDYTQARKYFTQASQMGNPMAKDNIAYLERLQKLKKAVM